MPRVIISADDFGLAPQINAAILCAVEKGAISSVSVAVCGQAFRSGAPELKKVGRGVSVGLHFTLDSENPISAPGQIATLVGTRGKFLPRQGLIKRLCAGFISAEHIRAELTAQLTRARDAGLEISHIDSHGHVHMHPRVFQVVRDVAQEWGIAGIRRSFEPAYLRGNVGSGGGKCLLLAMCNGVLCRSWQGVRAPDALAGLSCSGHMNQKRLELFLQRMLKDKTYELIMHPATEHVSSYGHWHYEWRDESALLESAGFRRTLREYDVTLINYGHL